MDKKTLSWLAGKPVNVAALAKRIGVSRTTIYDGFRRGCFTPKLARLIADDLGITDANVRARLVGM
jgi:lambda repressor-like predicted transcriptional regulator